MMVEHEHDWQQAWWCPDCGEGQLLSSTEHEMTDGRWTFTVRLAKDADTETLAHEIAHIVQRFFYGPDDEQHGETHKRLAKELGEVVADEAYAAGEAP
jgi:uncharacterized protein YdaU (DUF1376 family)